MTTPERLINFLKEKRIQHELIKHPEAFTAQEVAHAIHKTGKLLAKTVIVEADGKHIMAVVPAHHKVNLNAVKEAVKAANVRLAREEGLRELFPDCDLGAMPPVGPLYKLPVILSTELTQRPEIIFNACTHTECVKIAYGDFEQLVKPQVAEISELPAESR